MKVLRKFGIRLFITTVIIVLIIFLLGVFLKIKYSDKLNKKELSGWDWTKENDLIWHLLYDKYPNEENEDFPIVLMKNQEIPIKEPDEKRVLIVGDSFVYGYGGTNVNYTWWKQLDLRVKQEGYNNINFYGAGRGFFNTKDQLEKILKNENLMKKVDPDLIIIGYVSNDPEERDETNTVNLVKDVWEVKEEDSELYQKNPVLYYEFVDRMNALGTNEYDKLIELGNKIGYYRWDARLLYLVKGERLDRYSKILKEVDDYIKGLNIPYFYFFTNNIDNKMVTEANNIVLNEMKKLDIKAYHHLFDSKKMLDSINSKDVGILTVNPVDSHPGITWSYEYGKKAYQTLKNDYKFLFENAKKGNINDLDLNINDTTPFLEVKKVSQNIFEFEYPMSEEERTIYSKFLIYPIGKEYVKLNLQYPKNISKIIVNGENVKEVDLYVNTVDKEYGYDIDETFRKMTKCKAIESNVYEVNKNITSVNISVEFNNEDNRNIKIEFIE